LLSRPNEEGVSSDVLSSPAAESAIGGGDLVLSCGVRLVFILNFLPARSASKGHSLAGAAGWQFMVFTPLVGAVSLLN